MARFKEGDVVVVYPPKWGIPYGHGNTLVLEPGRMGTVKRIPNDPTSPRVGVEFVTPLMYKNKDGAIVQTGNDLHGSGKMGYCVYIKDDFLSPITITTANSRKVIVTDGTDIKQVGTNPCAEIDLPAEEFKVYAPTSGTSTIKKPYEYWKDLVDDTERRLKENPHTFDERFKPVSGLDPSQVFPVEALKQRIIDLNNEELLLHIGEL